MKTRKSLLESLLLSFLPFTEENLTLSKNPRAFVQELSKQYSVKENTIRVALCRAKKQGLIKGVEKNYEITNRGKLKIIKYMKNKGEWDGKWRLLFFDIPEEQRYKREILRKKLKELGFKQHQLSAWISPFDFSEEIDVVITELELEDYIKYLIGETIIGGEELKEAFNLN